MPTHETHDTHHKALSLNLDTTVFGSFAEIGAGQEVARKQGGILKLLNLTNNAHNVMQVTRLYTVFDIMDNEAAAVESFGQSAAATR